MSTAFPAEYFHIGLEGLYLPYKKVSGTKDLYTDGVSTIVAVPRVIKQLNEKINQYNGILGVDRVIEQQKQESKHSSLLGRLFRAIASFFSFRWLRSSKKESEQVAVSSKPAGNLPPTSRATGYSYPSLLGE